MECITIKSCRTEGLVAVEIYDTDTDGVGGLIVKTSELRRWLRQRGPCQVHVRGRVYSRQPVARTAQPVPNAYRGMESWRANAP